MRVVRFANQLIRIAVPVGVALVLASFLVMKRVEVDHELQVIVPQYVRPGSILPIRVNLLGHLRRIEGPELIQKPVVADLISKDGKRWVGAQLQASFGNTMEGLLKVPAELAGECTLHTTATLESDELNLEIPIYIDSDAPPLSPQPRILEPLRQFSAGKLQTLEETIPPIVLEVRVVGGFCVPEQRCDVLIRTGSPDVAIDVIDSPSITLLKVDSTASDITSGIVPLAILTHGPEAKLRLQAKKESRLVAKRAIRLPIALAASSLRLRPQIISNTDQPVFRLEDKQEDPGCIVDIFHENHWLFTGWIRECRTDTRLPYDFSAPGLWRIQARRDPYSANTASTRSFFVSDSSKNDNELLSAIATTLSAYHPRDEYVKQVAVQPVVSTKQDLADQVAFLLISDETELIPLPNAVSSFPHTQAKLHRQQKKLHRYSLLFLTLAGFTLGLLIARRGLRAASKAREIMLDAGDKHAYAHRKVLQMTFTVLAAVTAILLTFVAIAIYMIARDKGF